MVHHLQQHVEDVRVRLLDLVEQQYRVRLLGNGLGQQTALVKTDVARRRADQAAHGMALHVLRHVEADQLDAHDVGQLLGGLGLADTRGAGEEKAANRLVVLAQAGARHLDGGREHVEGLVLAEHHALEVAFQGLELAAVIIGDVGGRNAGDLRHDFLDLGLGDGFLALVGGQDALGGARLVDDVDRLVGQMPVIDVLGAQLGRGLQGGHGVLDAVVLFKARLEPFEDLDRFLHRRLDHIDLLEAPRQGRVLLENTAVFGEGGRANALELARAQRRLEQVGRVQRTARSRTGTDQGVDFVDEQDAVGLVFQRFQHALEALLKVAAVFGAGQQGAHVERIHVRLGQDFRHVFLRDAPGQALGNGGFTHAGLTHQQRVVLAAAAENLDHALDFVVTADQRIDLAVPGELVQVLRVLLQRRGFFVLLAALFVLRGALAGLGRLGRVALLDAVRDEVHDVQARDALLVQVIHGMRVFFAEDGDQHIGAGDFLLAVAGGLHMHDGALDHTLETQRGLRVDVVGACHLRRVVLDEIGKRLAQIIHIGRTGAQHFSRTGVVQQSEQQVFHRDELVTLLPRFDKGHVQADF